MSAALSIAGNVAVSMRSTAATADFDALVLEHQRRIHRVLLAILRDPDAAETLTQETFLRAYQARKDFRGEASVGTWLVKIAVNLARDHMRSRRVSFWHRLFSGGEDSVTTAAEVMPDWRPTPEQGLALNQQVAAIWRAAAALPQQQRTVFTLRFVEEMSLEEIAAATSLRVGTVKAHLFRAVASVREHAQNNVSLAADAPRKEGKSL